ncbi:unnamed protein product [Auanema sp. JU1783]|nr:unnamed protein product [Auanema sp. JU1783]
MVELCELKQFVEEDQWPADIDTRIANLDFGGDSVLFESFDPSVSTDSLDSAQLREQCRPRTDDYQMAFADSGHWQSGIGSGGPAPLTTWGRIHSTEPLDDKTASAPDIGPSIHTGLNGTVGINLTSNSIHTRLNSRPRARPTSLLANFVDNRRSDAAARYVDINDNEIVSPGLQRADRWRAPRASTAPAKPRRTFADLQKNIAPELHFLALPHKMPTLFRREGIPSITSDIDLHIPNLLQDDSPDSGFASSGPSHIEDWSSLSILLPKHVADACSFFKSNAQLLSSGHPSNCIERSRRSEPCTTCFRVRRKVHPPNWAQSATSRHVLCDCSSSEHLESNELMPRISRPSTCPQLRSRELSIVGLPIYSVKRTLVEAVVDAVAGIARGEDASGLVHAMEALVSDGLSSNVTLWDMIKTVTAPGPATKDVYSIVKALDNSEKSNNSRVEIFFEELIKEHSLDCWLSYVVLKENVLKKLYEDGAFLLSCPSAYRSLLWRLIDCLAIIPVLEARDPLQTRSMWSRPTRIVGDSRVPKSSSVPARLSVQTIYRVSRIPLAKNRPTMTRAAPADNLIEASPMASIIDDAEGGAGQLFVSRGEQVRVLSTRGNMAKCCRVNPRRSHITTGSVPVSNLILQK